MGTKAYKHKGKKVLEVQTRGDSCTCSDCPVLYGEECPTSEVLLYETEQARWYDNGMADNFPKDYKAIIVEKRPEGVREYVLFFKGEPIYTSQSFEAIAIRMDIHKAKGV